MPALSFRYREQVCCAEQGVELTDIKDRLAALFDAATAKDGDRFERALQSIHDEFVAHGLTQARASMIAEGLRRDLGMRRRTKRGSVQRTA